MPTQGQLATVSLSTVSDFLVRAAWIRWVKLRYHNAIWHGFVLAASGCHFAAIMDAIGLTAAA